MQRRFSIILVITLLILPISVFSADMIGMGITDSANNTLNIENPGVIKFPTGREYKQPRFTTQASSWWNTTFPYRINITVSELGGYARDDWYVSVYVNFDPPAYKEGIRVVDTTIGSIVPFQVWNVSTVNATHLTGATITFLVDIPAGTTKIYQIYWTNEVVEPYSLTQQVYIPPAYTYEDFAVSGTNYQRISHFSGTYGGKINEIIYSDSATVSEDSYLQLGPIEALDETTPDLSFGTANTNTNDYSISYPGVFEKGPILARYLVSSSLYSGATRIGSVTYDYTYYWWGYIAEETVTWSSDFTLPKDYSIGTYVFPGDSSLFNYYVLDSLASPKSIATNILSTDSYTGSTSSSSLSGSIENSIRVFSYYLVAGNSYTITLEVTADFDLYVYDSNGNFYSYSAAGGSSTEYVSVTPSSSGYWFFLIVDYAASTSASFTLKVNGNVIGTGTGLQSTYTWGSSVANSFHFKLINPALLDQSSKIEITTSWSTGASYHLQVWSHDNSSYTSTFEVGTAGASPLSVTLLPSDSSKTYIVLMHSYSSYGAYSGEIKYYEKITKITESVGSNYLALIHDTNSHGLAIIPLSISESVSSYSSKQYEFVINNVDGTMYLLWMLKYNGLQASAGDSITFRYAVYVWEPSGTLTDRYNQVVDFVNRIKNELDVSIQQKENYYIKTSVLVRDYDNNPVEGALVTLEGLETYQAYTNSSGYATFYVERTAYTVSVELSSAGRLYTNSTSVDYSSTVYTDYVAATIPLDLDTVVKIELFVVDNRNLRIQNVQVNFTDPTNLTNVISITTNLTGGYKLYLPRGDWNLTVSYASLYDTYSLYYWDGTSWVVETNTSGSAVSSVKSSVLSIQSGKLWKIIDSSASAPTPTELEIYRGYAAYPNVEWGTVVELSVRVLNASDDSPIGGLFDVVWHLEYSNGTIVPGFESISAPYNSTTLAYDISLDTTLINAGESYVIKIEATTTSTDYQNPVPLSIPVTVEPVGTMIQVLEISSYVYYYEAFRVRFQFIADGSPISADSVTVRLIGDTTTEIATTYSDGTYTAYVDNLDVPVGLYMLEIVASKENYETASYSTSIVVQKRPLQVSLESLYVDLEWGTDVKYFEISLMDKLSDTPLKTADGSYIIKDSTTGEIVASGSVNFSIALNNYYIALDPTAIGIGKYIVEGYLTKTNWENATFYFTLEVQPRSTELVPEKFFVSSYWGSAVAMNVTYKIKDTSRGIEDATLSFEIFRIGEKDPIKSGALMALGDGVYLLNISYDDLGVGTYIITITASKMNYTAQRVDVQYIIKPVPVITIVSTNYIEAIYGQKLNVTIDLIDMSTSKEIADAEYSINLIYEGKSIPYKDIISVNVENNKYVVTIDTFSLNISQYTLIISFSKQNYVINNANVTINVQKIPLKVQLSSDTKVLKSFLPGTSTKTKVNIILTRADTYSVIDNATILVKVMHGTEVVKSIQASKGDVPGNFQAEIIWDDIEPGDYVLKVEVKGILVRENEVSAQYIVIQNEESTSLSVSVDYIGGSTKIGDKSYPNLVIYPSLAAVLIIVGAFTYRVITFLLLPEEVKELMKLISNIEKGNYEYVSPTREEVFKEHVLKALKA